METSRVLTTAGPVPDRMTIWPMDDGRYGLDATFQGASGPLAATEVSVALTAFVQ